MGTASAGVLVALCSMDFRPRSDCTQVSHGLNWQISANAHFLPLEQLQAGATVLLAEASDATPSAALLCHSEGKGMSPGNRSAVHACHSPNHSSKRIRLPSNFVMDIIAYCVLHATHNSWFFFLQEIMRWVAIRLPLSVSKAVHTHLSIYRSIRGEEIGQVDLWFLSS